MKHSYIASHLFIDMSHLDSGTVGVGVDRRERATSDGPCVPRTGALYIVTILTVVKTKYNVMT